MASENRLSPDLWFRSMHRALFMSFLLPRYMADSHHVRPWKQEVGSGKFGTKAPHNRMWAHDKSSLTCSFVKLCGSETASNDDNCMLIPLGGDSKFFKRQRHNWTSCHTWEQLPAPWAWRASSCAAICRVIILEVIFWYFFEERQFPR